MPARAALAALLRVALLVGLAGLAAACGGDDAGHEVESDAAGTVRVASTAFADGDAVPVRFTCDGDEVSPPLAWSSDEDVAAWAVVVDDPDAPDGTFTHWVLLDVPAATRSIAEGEVPDDAAQAENSAGDADWTGPCPPSGTHHYRFTVYGLSKATGLGDGASLEDALAAVGDAAVAEGTLVGTYQRQ